MSSYTMEERNKAMEKVRKLLALAGEDGYKQDNKNEASAAFKKAAELMAQYDLSTIDIRMESDDKSWLIDKKIDQSNSKHEWKKYLMANIAEVFDVKMFLGYKGAYFRLVGSNTDIALTEWYFKYLSIRIAREASTFPTEKEKYSFGLGCSNMIHKRMDEMFKKVMEQEQHTDTMALVVYKKDAIDQYIAQNFRAGKPHRSNRSIDSAAYFAGQVHGNSIGLNRPIEA